MVVCIHNIFVSKSDADSLPSFIILRYSGILATLPALFFTSVQSQHCQFAASISQAGVVLAVGASGVIFSYRVFAIWSGNKIVYALVSFMFLLMIACWVR